MTTQFCPTCGALRRGAVVHEAVFDVADELTAGDVFRWPAGNGASSWRVTAVIGQMDEIVRRVAAVPVTEAGKGVRS